MSNEILQVTNLQEAKKFILDCLNYIGLGFHPDNDFKDYVDSRNPETTLYTEETAIEANKLLDACFDMFDEAGEDIYEYTLSLL